MSRRQNARAYIEDMLDACNRIQKFTSGITEEAFLSDELRQFAVIRAIELLGEAAKQLTDVVPDAQSRFPSLPIREMYATRNRLIHGYSTVLPQTVWEIVTTQITLLQQSLRSILTSLQNEP